MERGYSVSDNCGCDGMKKKVVAVDCIKKKGKKERKAEKFK